MEHNQKGVIVSGHSAVQAAEVEEAALVRGTLDKNRRDSTEVFQRSIERGLCFSSLKTSLIRIHIIRTVEKCVPAAITLAKFWVKRESELVDYLRRLRTRQGARSEPDMLLLRNSLFQTTDNRSFNELTVFLHPLQLGGVRSVGRLMQEFNLPISRQVRLIGKKISGVFMLLQIVLTTEGDEDMHSKFKMVVSVLRFLSRLRTNGSCVLKNILLGADRAEREIISLLSKVPRPCGICPSTDWKSFGVNRINDYLEKVTKLAVSLDMLLSLTLMPCPPSCESLMVMRDVIEYYSKRLTQLQLVLWEDIIPALKDEEYELKVTSRIDKNLISVMKPYLQGLWK